MKMCIDFVQCPTVVRTVCFQNVYNGLLSVLFLSLNSGMYYSKRKIQIIFDVLLISSVISIISGIQGKINLSLRPLILIFNDFLFDQTHISYSPSHTLERKQ